MRMIMCSKCANEMLADKIYAFEKKDCCQCCGKKCFCGIYNVIVEEKKNG